MSISAIGGYSAGYSTAQLASRIKAPSAEDFAAKLIAEKDTDGDGALSVSEASAGNRGLPEDLFGKIDADGDGLLTQDEIVAGRPEGPPPRLQELNGSAYGLTQRFSVEDAVSQLIAEKDSDGDGALSVEEAAAGDRGLPGELIAALDTDGDGILSEEELIAGAPQGPPPGAPPGAPPEAETASESASSLLAATSTDDSSTIGYLLEALRQNQGRQAYTENSLLSRLFGEESQQYAAYDLSA